MNTFFKLIFRGIALGLGFGLARIILKNPFIFILVAFIGYYYLTDNNTHRLGANSLKNSIRKTGMSFAVKRASQNN